MWSRFTRKARHTRARAFGSGSSRVPSSSRIFGAGKGVLMGAGLMGLIASFPLFSNWLQQNQIALAEEELSDSDPSIQTSTDDGAQQEEEDEEPEIPPLEFDFVLVGAGTASYNAMREIVTHMPDAKILIVGDEEIVPPYQRPPLSKELWWEVSEDVASQGFFKDPATGEYTNAIYVAPDDYPPNVTLMLGKQAVDLDAGRKLVSLNDGTNIKFSKILLATGSSPQQPAIPLPNSPFIQTYRSVADFQRLLIRATQANAKHITVVGGGFLGTELACSLALKKILTGVEISQVFPEDGVLSKVFPSYLSEYATSKLRRDGVDVRNRSDVAAITESGERLRVELRNGDSFETDHVVFAIGAKPNTTLAEKAFLEIDQVNGGIVANAELAARSDIYVAGDVVSYYDPYVGRRREQHHDHARISGRVAGFNMTGERKAYLYQPMFWGSVSDSAFQGVGIVDTSLTNVGVFQRGPLPTDATNQDITPSNEYYEKGALERGAVYYMKDKRVVGVLLWNIPDKLEDARRSVIFPRDFEDISRVQTQIDFAPAVQTDDDQ